MESILARASLRSWRCASKLQSRDNDRRNHEGPREKKAILDLVREGKTGERAGARLPRRMPRHRGVYIFLIDNGEGLRHVQKNTTEVKGRWAKLVLKQTRKSRYLGKDPCNISFILVNFSLFLFYAEHVSLRFVLLERQK